MIVHARPFIAGLVKRSTYVVTVVYKTYLMIIPNNWLVTLYFQSFSAHRVYTWKQPAQSIEVLINRDGVGPVYACLSIQQRWSQSSL